MNEQTKRWKQLLGIHQSARDLVEQKEVGQDTLENARNLTLELKLMAMMGSSQEEKVMKSSLQKMLKQLVDYIQKRIEYHEFVDMNDDALKEPGLLSGILDGIFNNSDGIKQRNRTVKTANTQQAKLKALFEKIDLLDDEVERIISLH